MTEAVISSIITEEKTRVCYTKNAINPIKVIVRETYKNEMDLREFFAGNIVAKLLEKDSIITPKTVD